MPSVDLGSVIGPQGPQGATGPQGAQGIQGPAGPNQITESTSTTLSGILYGENGNVAAKGIVAAGGSPVYGKGVNLLDNWYFGSRDAIIDQRGGYVVPPDTPYYPDTNLSGRSGTVSAYTTSQYVNSTYGTITVDGSTYYVKYGAMVRGYTRNGYKIDRWSLDASDSILLINDDNISLGIGASSWANLRQRIEKPERLAGKTITFSILGKGIGKILYQVNSDYPGEKSSGNTGMYELVSSTITLGEVSRIDLIIKPMDTNSMFCVKAVKLEFGDTQTLAHQDANGNWVLNDPPPDYGVELLKCQRYLRKLDSQYQAVQSFGSSAWWFQIPFDPPMRAAPPIIGLDTAKLYLGGILVSGATFEMGATRDNYANITVRTNFNGANRYSLQFQNAFASAEL